MDLSASPGAQRFWLLQQIENEYRHHRSHRSKQEAVDDAHALGMIEAYASVACSFGVLDPATVDEWLENHGLPRLGTTPTEVFLD